MPSHPRSWCVATVCAALCFLGVSLRAVTLDELRADKHLTPQRFASYFTDFKYEYGAQVQPPEIFLATKSGDCDDYATLADLVLREKGYTTRLITVRTKSVVHVVCYVEESKTILDYNNRGYLIPTVSSSDDLPSIAKKVAKDFGADWTSATEFTFDGGLKRLVKTVLRADRAQPPRGHRPRAALLAAAGKLFEK